MLFWTRRTYCFLLCLSSNLAGVLPFRNRALGGVSAAESPTVLDGKASIPHPSISLQLFAISWFEGAEPGMDLVGCFVLIDVGDCAGIPCSFILGTHSNFKINQYAKEKSFGACPWVQGDFTCNNARAPCNQRDQAQILLGTACVTLVASIINSAAHGVSRLRLHL